MLLLIILSFAGFSLALFGTIQSVAATGRLFCYAKPAPDVKVYLYEKEPFPLFDKKMDEGRTNLSGGFYLTYQFQEVFTIDPKLYVYHKCKHDWPFGCRKFGVRIPDDYITEGNIPTKAFNIGTIELSGKISGESWAWFC